MPGAGARLIQLTFAMAAVLSHPRGPAPPSSTLLDRPTTLSGAALTSFKDWSAMPAGIGNACSAS